jgi:hypothetical protein|tara:strand:+ start:1158 stop:3335 length:2178 start_codon:yes stop_codon:yes gene_type:complete
MASIFSSLLGIGESSPRVAPTGTVVTEEKLATEIAPFYKDLLAKSQALHDARVEEGFQPFQGQTVADLNADEIAAREGIRGLVGSQQADYDEARRLYGLQTEKFTADTAQEYLNPYQQAVTDVSLRKAEEDFSRRVMPKFEKFASDAGGMSGLGSRAGVQAGGLGEAFMQNLSDIQTKGSAAGFADARAAFEAQKRREGLTASRLPTLAGQEYGTRARELAGLTAIGEDERARVQTSLDEDYKNFLEERRFPEDQLQRYQSTIQGFPNIKNEIVTTSTRQPSGIQNFLSTASGLGSLYGSFGGFSDGGFGSTFGLTSGPGGSTKSARHGGLVGLPVVKAQQGSQGRTLSQDITDNVVLQRLGRGAALTAGPVYDISSEIIRYLTGYDAGSAQDLTGISPYNISKDAKATLAQLKGRVPTAQASPQVQDDGIVGDIDVVGGPGGLDYRQREYIAEAEAVQPGFRRDKTTPTGFAPGNIEIGTSGISADDYMGALPPGASVRPQEPTKSDAQKLYELTIKQAADRKSALEGAKESKAERNAKRKEEARIRDLVDTLGRFAGNILDPESNIGSAFGKTTTQMAASRQAEADRQAAAADTIDDLNAKIAIAAADGDVAALTALIKAKKDAEELRIKGTTADAALKNALAKQSTALWNRLKDIKDINLKEADLILALNEAYASAKTNPAAAKDILKKAGIPEGMVKGIIINLQTITQSAGQASDIPRPRS